MAPTAADFAARNLRAERSRLRWTQADLAKRLDWSQSKIAALENGQRRITLDQAVELCRALNVPLVKLLEGAAPEDLSALGLISS